MPDVRIDVQQFADFARGNRTREEEALQVVAAGAREKVSLLQRLDALGGHVDVQGARQGYDCLDDGVRALRLAEMLDE